MINARDIVVLARGASQSRQSSSTSAQQGGGRGEVRIKGM